MYSNEFNKQMTHVEVIWGTPILDEGFTPIPNLIIRYASELMTPKEFQFICVLATFKHDSRDPYPSQETLGKYLGGISERAVRKLVDGLEEKGLLAVGYRYVDGKRKNAVYSLKPLIDRVLELAGESRLPDTKPTEKIYWKTEAKKTTTGTKSSATTGTKSSATTGTKSSARFGTKSSGENNQSKLKMKIKNENYQSIREEVEQCDLPLSIKKVLLHNMERLVGENISIFDISIVYHANKDMFNEYEFAIILDHVLRETTGKIRSIKSRLKKGMETYRRPTSSPNAENLSKALIRTEMLPDWFNMDYSQKEPLTEEENLHDLEQKRQELEERLKKYSP
ncbi:biotin operon repressor [Anoxybacillus calidus]|uniref:Biotin operon repressor n=1 Tax=[Anoxybacillus] calidus TaxID=575178 RepID=A0A7V9Z382_9BACL|nr:helix-turn-helix domain-containing protein [Anoxybacillus calidus]MBA2873155.1 biotin operon repressor [Anoxybacillus calidus]